MRTSTDSIYMDTENHEAFPMEVVSDDEDMEEQDEIPDEFEEFEELSDDEIPPPPPLVRQNAVMGRQEMTLREQEIRFIEENGLIAFCNGNFVTAILRNADYLRAQLVYIG